MVMPSQAAHECVRLGFSSQDKQLFLETMPPINSDVNHLNLKWMPLFLFKIKIKSSCGKLNSCKIMPTLKLKSIMHHTSSIADW
ncbi:hypothetical protein SADUNF_Sadunf16G0241200 [Salix dunnii]|uniref:Uncharacterized protein n=1 Tax=Salix dunnii TaxID=1413687 RepID=A0A835JBR6_9ROSI|nr:hypothetical protein SADUNF_Sadunf16G0241200 [Salix dunnii]